MCKRESVYDITSLIRLAVCFEKTNFFRYSRKKHSSHKISRKLSAVHVYFSSILNDTTAKQRRAHDLLRRIINFNKLYSTNFVKLLINIVRR